MVSSGEKASYCSLSKLEMGSHDDEDSDFLVDYGKSSLPGSRVSRQDYLYPPSSDLDFPEQRDPGPNSFYSSQSRANPEVNLKNVLSGLAAILLGRCRSEGGIQPQLNCSSDISFFSSGLDGDSLLHPSVCVPSAPPLEVESINYSAYKEVLDADPPEWLPDSYSRVCMQCNSPFTAIMRGRHHCRFCGGIFCRECTKGRCLLPVKFRERNPQRVCDTCYERLDPLQSILIISNSNSVQSAKHDVTDWTCFRGWLNFPVSISMEYEIYKATCTLRSYCQVQFPNFSL